MFVLIPRRENREKSSYPKPVQQYGIAIQYCHSPGTRSGRKAVNPMTTLISAETTAPPVIAAPAKVQGAVSQGAASQDAASQDKGLRAGALGLLSSVVI